MTDAYIQQVLRVIVAQTCQTIGWHSIQTTPLELLVDILHKYLQEITRDTYRHTELYNRTEPNLDDIGLSFRNLNISIAEIEEYITYVQPQPCAIDVPKLPVSKESNLNFLKPGSKEVLTRPVHVNEFLPPIFPEKEAVPSISNNSTDNDSTTDNCSTTVAGKSPEHDTVFKKPELHDSSVISSALSSNSAANDTNIYKKSRLPYEEEGRPTREITSVMMTSSGFISPAREGKLPESKKPPIISEYRTTILRSPSPKPNIQLHNSNPGTPIDVIGLSPTHPSSALTNNQEKSKSNNLLSSTKSSSSINKKRDPNASLNAKLLKKLKKKSSITDKEQRKRDKLSKSLTISQNKALKQLQKQQQQQLKQNKNLASQKKLSSAEKLSKKQKKLKSREFNMEHNIMKEFSNRNKNPMALLQQSAAIAASSGIPLSELHNQSGNFTMSHGSGHHSMAVNRYPSDVKLSTEPDKNKLNIFKKISSSKKDKDDHIPKSPALFSDSQLITLPSGTTITPTMAATGSLANERSSSKYPTIMDSDQIICVDDYERPSANLMSTSFHKNSSSSSGKHGRNSQGSSTKIPKKLKRKLQQMEPLNLSNDHHQSSSHHGHGSQPKVSKKNNPSADYVYNKHHSNPPGRPPKEKKERTKKPKTKTSKKSSTVTNPQFLEPFQPNRTIPENISYPNMNAPGPSSFMYPLESKSTENLDEINKKLMKIDTVMQPAPPINTVSSPDDGQEAGPSNPIVNDPNNPETPESAAAAAYFSKQYLTGQMGAFMPMSQMFPFPLSFQPRPGLIPTPGLFQPLPSVLTENPVFNDFLPIMNFPTPKAGTAGSDAQNQPKMGGGGFLNDDNDNFSNLQSLAPLMDSTKSYCNVAPLVPESMIQKFQMTSNLLKQQEHAERSAQQQQLYDELQPDYHEKLQNKSSKYNYDAPIEISDDEKMKSDTDERPHKSHSSHHSHTVTSTIVSGATYKNIPPSFLSGNGSGGDNDQGIITSSTYHHNDNDENKYSQKLNYNNYEENRTTEGSDVFSSDHEGGAIGGEDGGGDGSGSGGGAGEDDMRHSGNDGNLSKHEKHRKEHKKGKKTKEGKIKKKKDKKDKSRSKEKSEKKRDRNGGEEHHRKDKEKSKKSKKEKKRDKHRMAAASTTVSGAYQIEEAERRGGNNYPDETNRVHYDRNYSSAEDNSPASAVPKLTLKLGIGKSPTPDSLDGRTITIKSSGYHHQQQHHHHHHHNDDYNNQSYEYRRDTSPELARISPLVTRPPKYKSKDKDRHSDGESPSSTTTTPTTSAAGVSAGHYHSFSSGGDVHTQSALAYPTVQSTPVSSRGPGRPKGSGNKSSSSSHYSGNQNLSGGVGGIGSTIVSGLEFHEPLLSSTNHHAVSSSTGNHNVPILNTTDGDGNQVWICPACGRVDDGTPMIGCDGCDAWYHWVCVGIQVPPDDNEDWYCRVCITKKQNVYESDKKKKRKKKNKAN